MKVSLTIYLLLLLLLFFSCRKETEQCRATVNLRLENRTEDIEWAEVIAGRQDQDGYFYIDALGVNDERFHLSLRHITDTGTVTGLTVLQLNCTDGIGFYPQLVQSGFVRITARNASQLSGTFEVFFQDNTNAAKQVKVEGAFKIFGQN